MLITDRLLQLRKQSALTQASVAAHIGVERTTYVRYEKGEIQPPTDSVVLLANLFDVTTDYLLGVAEKSTPELVIPEILKDVQVAFHHGEDPLTQDEINELEKYAQFLKSKRDSK